MQSDGRTVHISNIPRSTTEAQIRPLFQQCGQVLAFRFVDSKRGPDGDFKYGFCDFSDAAGGAAAIAKFDGYEMNGQRLRVALAERSSKRVRDDRTFETTNPVEAAAAAELGLPLGQQFTPSAVCPASNPLQALLATIPQNTLYEAVEQLRGMAIDRPDDALALLEANPQLRHAIVLILQHGGVLPAQLPPEAFSDKRPEVAAASTSGDAATMQAIQDLSEDELQHILSLSKADLEELPEPSRSQLAALQGKLKLLVGS